LRPSLYIKDDDYLLSYMHGNFVTLTNINAKDIDNIIKYRIEPLHVSVHSTNPEIRKIIFGTGEHQKGLEYLKIIDKAGIMTAIQVVLIPGLNDGGDLRNTIKTLTEKYNNIGSIGIVPVGVTRYNRRKEVSAVTVSAAKKVVSQIETLKGDGINISGKVFLSDEFYLISGTPFPPFKSYGRFPQIDNGIGKSIDFLSDINTWAGRLKNRTGKHGGYKKILLVTSEYGNLILRESIRMMAPYYEQINMHVIFDILSVKNDFLGGNVKVTGLLAGSDIIRNIKGYLKKYYSSIFIPACIFNDSGITLDGYTKEDISSVGKNVKIVNEDGKSLVDEINKVIFNR